MAAPLFTFHSIFQPDVSYDLNADAGGGIGAAYGSNGYDDGCPGFQVYGGSDRAANLAFDVSSHSLADGWLRFRFIVNRHDALQPAVIFSGPTADLLRIRNVNAYAVAPDFRFEYYSGSAWVQIGSDITSIENTDIDIHWKIDGTTGVFEFYRGGALVESVSGDTLHTADTTIDTISFYGSENSPSYGNTYWHLFVDNVDTRGLYMAVDAAAGAGAYDTFVGGDWTDVNEYPGASQWSNDYIVGNAVGDKFTCINTSIDSNLESIGTVETVFFGFGGTASADPAFYAKPLLRIAGTDYNPPGSIQPLAGINSGKVPTYLTFYAIEVPLDPATGAAWANVAAIEAAEFGFQISATA